MSYQQFEEWNPSRKSQVLVYACNEILREYEALGYKLTLRQLYYQLVSRDMIPNNQRQYNSLGNVVNKARLAGLMDWSMIEDRVRIPKENTHWKSPEQILKAAASSYYLSKWKDQRHYVEVWCEKDAVSNIIQPICEKYDVLFMANRGYSSQSAMYQAYKRLAEMYDADKEIHVIYLGDHDPSGIDMSRDITDRLNTFLFNHCDYFSGNRRLALNMEQVEEYNPPVNPAKMSDTRFRDYVKRYGHDCWELDALKPDVLEGLVEDAILDYCDMDIFMSVQRMEEAGREKLIKIADRGI